MYLLHEPEPGRFTLCLKKHGCQLQFQFVYIFAEFSCKGLTFCRTDIVTEIKFPFVKTTDSKAFNLMIIKLDPAETTFTRSWLS